MGSLETSHAFAALYAFRSAWILEAAKACHPSLQNRSLTVAALANESFLPRQLIRLAILVLQILVRRVLLVNCSVLPSHSSNDFVLCAMLPISVADVSRWPISMSQLHVLRLLTQSRKLRACSGVPSLPPSLLRRLDLRLAPSRHLRPRCAVDRRPGRELVGRQHVRHDFVAAAVQIERALGAAEDDLGPRLRSSGRRWC